MQLTRALPLLGALTLVVAVACSDSGTTAPDGPRSSLGTSGKSDTSVSPAPKPSPTAPNPDSGKTSPTNPGPTQPGPDTAGSVPRSTEPRTVAGSVVGMGPVGDSANVSKVAGATVVWKSVDGTELARATTAANGSFSLGSYKPGTYMLTVTAPAGSPWKSIEWAFIISEYSPAQVQLDVWLGRK